MFWKQVKLRIANGMALILIGASMFEIAGRLITRLEALGDYESPIHMSLVVILAQGMVFTLIGMVKSYQLACDEAHISYHTSYRILEVPKKVVIKLSNFMKNTRAAVTPKTLILLAVGFLLVGILSPIAIGTIFNATTTGWNASVKTVFQVILPIIYVVACALYLLPGGKH